LLFPANAELKTLAMATLKGGPDNVSKHALNYRLAIYRQPWKDSIFQQQSVGFH